MIESNIFKTALKAAALISGRIAMYTIGGTAISWSLMLALLFLATGMNRIIVIITWLLFGVIFPVLYFMAGQKAGIQKALAYLYQGNQHFLFDYISTLFFKNRRVTAVAQGTQQSFNEYKPQVLAYLYTLQGVPKLLKPLVRHFVNKTGIPQGLTQYDQLDLNQEPLDAEKLSQVLQKVVGSKIEDALAPAALSLFWKLALLEAVLFAVCFSSNRWLP
ncbi:MAG: hypothetical protein V4714_10960 [Bacteroidota bacterium]